MSKKQEIFWLPKDISCWCHQMSRFCAENLVRIHTFEVFFLSFQVFCEFECLLYENTFVLTFIMGIFCLRHSHRKRRDSLESSLDRVLFAAKPEFLKILVPRLPQNSSNAKIKFAEKPKQLLFTWPASWSTDISSFCYSDIDLFFIVLLIMPAVNYVIHGYSSLRTTPGVITLHELHTGGKTLLQLLLKIGWLMTIWKDKSKTELCILVDYSY